MRILFFLMIATIILATCSAAFSKDDSIPANLKYADGFSAIGNKPTQFSPIKGGKADIEVSSCSTVIIDGLKGVDSVFVDPKDKSLKIVQDAGWVQVTGNPVKSKAEQSQVRIIQSNQMTYFVNVLNKKCVKGDVELKYLTFEQSH